MENVVTCIRFPLQLELTKSEHSRSSYCQIIHLGFWGNFDSISPKTYTFPLYKTSQLRTTNQITITNNTNHNELIFKGVHTLIPSLPTCFFSLPSLCFLLLNCTKRGKNLAFSLLEPKLRQTMESTSYLISFSPKNRCPKLSHTQIGFSPIVRQVCLFIWLPLLIFSIGSFYFILIAQKLIIIIQ